MLLAACEANLEGIVGKKSGSVYSGTRNGDWIKLKCDTRQEFVIGGYTLTDKKTSGVSALLLGIYEDGDLVYVGRAGTGFTERLMKELEAEFENKKRNEAPFKQAPRPKSNEKIIWLDPVLVAEVKFAEWTADRLLRQASFKGLRMDKDPRDIRREKKEKQMKQAGDMLIGGIKITSPDKVIFDDPETTKLDVIQYYEKVSERMLPYLSRRILSIVRCPKGVTRLLLQKHPGPGGKSIVTIPVLNSKGETEEYFYIESAQALFMKRRWARWNSTPGSRIETLESRI